MREDSLYDEREELLDAREVVEAADEMLAAWAPAVQRQGFRPLGFEKLEAALKEYWRKWGEKERK